MCLRRNTFLTVPWLMLLCICCGSSERVVLNGRLDYKHKRACPTYKYFANFYAILPTFCAFKLNFNHSRCIQFTSIDTYAYTSRAYFGNVVIGFYCSYYYFLLLLVGMPISRASAFVVHALGFMQNSSYSGVSPDTQFAYLVRAVSSFADIGIHPCGHVDPSIQFFRFSAYKKVTNI